MNYNSYLQRKPIKTFHNKIYSTQYARTHLNSIWYYQYNDIKSIFEFLGLSTCQGYYHYKTLAGENLTASGDRIIIFPDIFYELINSKRSLRLTFID